MPRHSWLPEGGVNVFQRIKADIAEGLAAGVKIVDLSVGEPEGCPPLIGRQKAASLLLSDNWDVHRYQDNSCHPNNDFARRFVGAHVTRNLFGANVAYLPIPGIKPMLGLIPLACGLQTYREFGLATTTNPGYPTPRVWARDYLGLEVDEPSLNPGNEFRLDMWDIDPRIVKLLMVNYPHNPSGQIATEEWWKEVCQFCSDYEIRLFNDAAYAALCRWPLDPHVREVTDWPKHVSLADIAPDFPELEWVEAFSASKTLINGTGWRVGALVGSPEFVADIAKIKGNTDSGFAAALALGALEGLELDFEAVHRLRDTYSERFELLIHAGQTNGLKLAVRPSAGFFTLWQAPKRAFGMAIGSGEEFNQQMIKRTGVVGVPFGDYIRYAVCKPFDLDLVYNAFAAAEVSYEV